MTDLEDLLTRTLRDERRALPVPAGSAASIGRAARRMAVRRRALVAGGALGAVGAVAAAVFVLGGTAVGASIPTQSSSSSAQPSSKVGSVATEPPRCPAGSGDPSCQQAPLASPEPTPAPTS
ncbi:MAG: hypothetical protein JWO88_617 [Frankiales bacterium]|nr:hypothetical protein [Frankiales bacterium]